MHLQKPINDWTNGLIPGLRQVVKFVDNVQALKDAKMVNPQCVTILRHWYDPGQVFGGTIEDNFIRAREFFDTFIDDTFREYAQYVDYIEGWNEYLANSQTSVEVQQRFDWAFAAAATWRERRSETIFGHIKLIICNTAIGNDIPRGFAEMAIEQGAVLGYHPYTHYQDGDRDPGDFRWLSGRWNTMEQEWRLKPTWAFTEGGPFQSAETGWRAKECLNGDRAAHIEAMREWYKDVQGTAAYKEGRIIGADYPVAVFNSGSDGKGAWASFENSARELEELAEMFYVERDAAPPVEPPTPEPEPVVKWRVKWNWFQRLNMRQGPGTDYEIVGSLATGSIVQGIETRETPTGDKWVKVADQPQLWLAARYHRKDYMERVP